MNIGQPLTYQAAPTAVLQAAFVASINEDDTINVVLFDTQGRAYANPPTHLRVVGEDDKLPERGGFCKLLEAGQPAGFNSAAMEKKITEKVDSRISGFLGLASDRIDDSDLVVKEFVKTVTALEAKVDELTKMIGEPAPTPESEAAKASRIAEEDQTIGSLEPKKKAEPVKKAK